jgi:hypothetical protein
MSTKNESKEYTVKDLQPMLVKLEKAVEDALDKADAKVKTIENRLESALVEIGQKLAGNNGSAGIHSSDSIVVQSKAGFVSHQVRDAMQLESLRKYRRIEVKASVAPGSFGSNAGAPLPARLFGTAILTQGSAVPVRPYMRITSDGSAAGVQSAYGAAKNNVKPDLLQVLQQPVTVAGLLDSIPEQQLANFSELATLLDVHLRRKIALAIDAFAIDGGTTTGAGSFGGMPALATEYASIYADISDRIVDARNDAIAHGFNVDLIALSPADYTAIVLARADDETGSYQRPTAVDGSNIDAFAGCRVTMSPALDTGVALLVDTSLIGIETDGAIRVQAAYDTDDFSKNLITVRGEVQLYPIVRDVRALISVVEAES